MKASMGVPGTLAAKVGRFVTRRKLSIRVVRDGPCLVRVALSERRRAATRTVLYAGGWISCPAARRMAARLRLSLRHVGPLMDVLDIKIRGCEMGCF